jgi:hypothetical protein
MIYLFRPCQVVVVVLVRLSPVLPYRSVLGIRAGISTTSTTSTTTTTDRSPGTAALAIMLDLPIMAGRSRVFRCALAGETRGQERNV